MRILRSRREIQAMRRAGLVVWCAHQRARRLIQPGITTQEIDRVIHDTFRQFNAEPLFLGYQGGSKIPFPAATCISVNEEVVHGIPSMRTLHEGDIVSIDTGCRLDGWCGDAAVTHGVGKISDQAEKLLNVTQSVLDLAISLLAKRKWWSEVAREMQEFVEQAGFSVVDQFVGHAIGRELHEKPQVPNFFDAKLFRTKYEDFELKPGTVIAIEPMVNAGGRPVRMLSDEWTQVTCDHSLSVHFEHTVAITPEGAWRLTDAPQADETLDSVLMPIRDELR
jgi:methionyl aminopeptidase